MSMEFENFTVLVREIMSQGFDEETASRYAAIIGDLPVRDSNGNILVRDVVRDEIVKLRPLKFFETKG